MPPRPAPTIVSPPLIAADYERLQLHLEMISLELGQPNAARRQSQLRVDSCLSWYKILDHITHCMRDPVATALPDVATTKATERFCRKEYQGRTRTPRVAKRPPRASSVVTGDREKQRLGGVMARERCVLGAIEGDKTKASFNNAVTSKGCGVWEILQLVVFFMASPRGFEPLLPP